VLVVVEASFEQDYAQEQTAQPTLKHSLAAAVQLAVGLGALGQQLMEVGLGLALEQTAQLILKHKLGAHQPVALHVDPALQEDPLDKPVQLIQEIQTAQLAEVPLHVLANICYL
jgi:hypothetical protein